jgi:glycosyltransferase involved in cell wall biosynthesis
MAFPKISIVIPAYNASRTLPACLQSMTASETRPFECIVVDDGSRDATRDIAQQFRARILSTGGRKGPAHARNLGAREAKGEVVFFIDADVCMRPDTISRLSATFAQEPEIDAIIGSYDDAPHAQDVLSLYRNLMHRYVHQNGRREATTFWSGCGAIRRSVFLKFGGFDEGYGRPAIEDIELGYRLTAGGHKILLDHGLEVKHLKRWTFVNLVKTDVFDRGIPWTELILRDGRMPNDLNVQTSQRVSVGLAFMLFGFALAGALYYKGLFVVPLLATALFTLACYWTETGIARGRGMQIGLTVLVAAFVGLAWFHHMLSLIPPVVVGYLLLFIRYRYAYKTEIQRKVTGIAYAAYLVVSLVFIARFLPARVPVICFYLMILLILAINRHFYGYLARRMGWLTALAAVPFHVLFYFYSGLSFITGLAMYSWRGIVSPRRNKMVGRVAG